MTARSNAGAPALSVVVPLYNEEESVRPLYEAIVAAVDPLALHYEMLFVDDGSRDDTFVLAEEIAKRDRRVRVVRFRANFGQTPAMAAGIDYARGDVIVTMDGDLQNDPGDIGAMLAKLEEGYDIVVGWRFNRQDKLVTRKIPSVIANRLIGKVTRCSGQGQWLFAEGVSFPCHQERRTLFGDASLHSCDGIDRRAEAGRNQGQSSCPAIR